MASSDRRERPWRKLRVIVEVTVPPNSRASEKDLKYAVEQCLPHTFKLPRPIHANFYEAAVRIKAFAAFWPVFLRKEKGIKNIYHRKTKETHDAFHGL